METSAIEGIARQLKDNGGVVNPQTGRILAIGVTASAILIALLGGLALLLRMLRNARLSLSLSLSIPESDDKPDRVHGREPGPEGSVFAQARSRSE